MNEKIIKYFKLNCKGAENARFKKEVINNLYDFFGIKLNEREFRDIISNIPEIGSHSACGYFWIDKKSDLDLHIADKKARLVTLSEIIKKAEDSYLEKNGNQLEIL